MRRTLPIALAVLGVLLSPRAVGAAEAPVQVGEPRPLSALTFQDMEGAETTLAAFTGMVVVLNLWATWCAPCREEMPSLDRLQARFADQDVVVLALSVDRAGPERVREFLDEVGVQRLHVYRDPKAAATRALKVPGLPATLLVDRQGREAGRVLGIARWDGPAAVEAVERLLAAPAG
jgi:thiol-disulfide isomerase/thioredoxin